MLSGNRNFEGRINPDVKMNFLASPPLVVAYALAGTMDWDPYEEPIGQDSDGEDVYLKDIWPSAKEVARVVEDAVRSDMFRATYDEVFDGDENWRALDVPAGRPLRVGRGLDLRAAPDVPRSTSPRSRRTSTDIEGARVLAKLGDSVTTDHISPAGAIKKDSPGRRVPRASKGVKPQGLQLLRLAPRQPRGDGARHVRQHPPAQPARAGHRGRRDAVKDGEEMSIYDAAMAYAEEGTPLVVLAGKEYGSGSSRDWAAKGTNLLGVRAVIAESFERIHRSNLVGMGVLPLQFPDGETAESLGLTGEEEFSITGLDGGEAKEVTVKAGDVEFDGARAHRHAQGSPVLPARRDPARSSCASCSEGTGLMSEFPEVLRDAADRARPVRATRPAPAEVFREACRRWARRW